MTSVGQAFHSQSDCENPGHGIDVQEIRDFLDIPIGNDCHNPGPWVVLTQLAIDFFFVDPQHLAPGP